MKPILLGAAIASAFISYFLLKRQRSQQNDSVNLSIAPRPVQHHLTNAFANAKRHSNGQ